MKKILLATTMLVGTAGFAAAEVTLSGDARMGIVYDSLNTDAKTEFNSRARVSFGLSGETDGGLSFGASFRADNAGGAASGTAGTVFVSGAFGKISMGDTSSAAEKAVGDLAEVGYTGVSTYVVELDDDLEFATGNEMNFISTGDNEMALYEYSTGAVTGYVSVGQPGDGNNTYSVGAKYSTDAYSFGIGYEKAEDFGKHIIASASGTFSGVTVKAVYGEFKGDGDFDGATLDQYGISASYAMGATKLDAFYRVNKFGEEGVSGTEDTKAFGVGATYDLGGGAAIEGGVTRYNTFGTKQNVADLGITFKF